MNERNAGAKPKYKQGVEVFKLQRRVPKSKVKEIDEAIKVICSDLINRLQSEALSKCADEALKSKL